MISVIIPSYKPEDYIYECLDSVTNQTLECHEYEIIVILNGTKEPYYNSLLDYSRQYINIKILYEEIGNVSNARNAGLKVAKGDYICFIDDDDIISSNYLEKLLEVSSNNVIGVSNVHSFTESIENWNDNFFACKVIQRQSYRKSFFMNRSILSFPVAKLIHKDIINNHFFDLRFKNGEDALFITSITDRLSHIEFTSNDAIYYVRERKGSASRKKIKKTKLVCDSALLIIEYIKIYLHHPFKYSFLLFASRIPGVLKNAYVLSKNK